MSAEDRLAALRVNLQRQLRGEFPGWQITFEESGQWSAIRPDAGVVNATSAAELRDRLQNLSQGTCREGSGGF